ncbi:TetR/AcrR family transcriptional regulator, partial [Acinetobacter baumannii]
MSMLASASLFFYDGLYVKARRVVLKGERNNK